MAASAFCGFETGSDAAGSREMHNNALFGTASIQSTVKRTGDYALRCNPTTTNLGNAIVTKESTVGAVGTNLDIATSRTHFAFRYATKPAANNEPFFQVNSAGGVKAELRLNSDGTISLYDSALSLAATGATVLSVNTWYRVGIEVPNGTSVTVVVKLSPDDGTSPATEITASSFNAAATNTDNVKPGKSANRNGQTVDFYYDDVYVDDATLVPDIKVARMDPDGNGNYTAWTGDYTSVDELATGAGDDGDTSYVNTSTNTNQESCTLESAASAGISGTIKAVKPFGSWYYTGSSATATLNLRSGSTDGTATSNGSAVSYLFRQKVYTLDPATGVAWTLAALDSIEPIVRHTQAQAREVRNTILGCMVAYDPTVATSAVGRGLTQSLALRQRRLVG